MSSLTSDRIIKSAEECFALDLISQQKLEFVTKMALTEPGYDPIIDLPLPWVIEEERRLRRRAARREFWRRLIGR